MTLTVKGKLTPAARCESKGNAAKEFQQAVNQSADFLLGAAGGGAPPAEKEKKKTSRSAGVVRIATASFYFHAPLRVGAAASGGAGLRQVSCTCVYSEEHKVEMRTSCKIMKCIERFAQRCENYLTGGATMGVDVNWK